MARQHLDLPPWGRQTRKSPEGSTRGAAPALPPPFPRENAHGAGAFPWADANLSTCIPLLRSPGPPWKWVALLRVSRLSPSSSNTVPKGPLPPSLLPRWVSPQSPASAGGALAPRMSPRAPTISAQVPDTQGLVPRGRHKDEASIGSEAQVSDHVLVPQEAEEEVSCGEGTR